MSQKTDWGLKAAEAKQAKEARTKQTVVVVPITHTQQQLWNNVLQTFGIAEHVLKQWLNKVNDTVKLLTTMDPTRVSDRYLTDYFMHSQLFCMHKTTAMANSVMISMALTEQKYCFVVDNIITETEFNLGIDPSKTAFKSVTVIVDSLAPVVRVNPKQWIVSPRDVIVDTVKTHTVIMLARSGHPETAGLTKLIKLYDPNYDRYFHQRAQLEISLNAPTYRTDLKQRANQSEIVAHCIPTMDMTAVAHQGVNRTTSPALKMEIQLYAIQLLQKMRQDDNNDLQIDHTAIMESIELIGDGNWDMVFSRVAGWNRSILGKQNTYMMVARNSAEADDLRNAIRHIKVQNTD